MHSIVSEGFFPSDGLYGTYEFQASSSPSFTFCHLGTLLPFGLITEIYPRLKCGKYIEDVGLQLYPFFLKAL